MSQNNIAPSLFDDGQIGGGSLPQQYSDYCHWNCFLNPFFPYQAFSSSSAYK